MRERVKQVLSEDSAALVTDVDGTISRIVDNPARAEVDPGIVSSLEELARRLSLVALLSGRAVHQLRQLVDIDRLVHIGNHGLERSDAGRVQLVPGADAYLEAMGATLRKLRQELRIPGVIVEDKGITGTIHYRLSPDPVSARRVVLEAATRAAESARLRVKEGRKSVNLLPDIPFDKGTAIRALVRDYRLEAVVYLGDDATDIDAFRALRRLANSKRCRALLIGVCVPESPVELETAADFCLPGVDAVADLLRECSQFVAMSKSA